MNIVWCGFVLSEPIQNMIKLTRQKYNSNGNTTNKNQKDYQLALARLELIFDAKKNSKEGDELEILSILIEKI